MTRTIASAIDDERTTNRSKIISTVIAQLLLLPLLLLLVIKLEEYVVEEDEEGEEEMAMEDQGGVDGEVDNKSFKKCVYDIPKTSTCVSFFYVYMVGILHITSKLVMYIVWVRIALPLSNS